MEAYIDMNLFREGNSASFEQIFRLYYKRICFFATKMLKDADASEDIAQDIFLRLFIKRKDFESVEKIKAYLYIACKNRCINYHRHQSVSLQFIERYLHTADKEENQNMDNMIHTELLHVLHKRLKKLPPRRKQVMELKYMEGFSLPKIAELLGISYVVVKEHLQLGRDAMRAMK